MAEYIEREALNKLMEIRRVRGECKFCAKYERCIENGINRKGSHLYCWEHINLPSADVVEVRHGEWMGDAFDDVLVCKECSYEHALYVLGKLSASNYCPNCGADMRGEKNGKK